MITPTNKDKCSLQESLAKALIKLSYDKLNMKQSKFIASKAIEKIDFKNSALMHKGVNWYAKQILNSIDIAAINF